MDMYSKVKPGDELAYPARLHNAMIDTVRDHERARASRGGDGVEQPFKSTIIKVQNDTGEDLAQRSIVGFEEAVFDPAVSLDYFQDRVVLAGRKPSLPDDSGRFGVLLADLAADDIGEAVLTGACVVQVMVTDATHRCAEAVDGNSDYLASTDAWPATQILWKETGTGLKWAVVQLGGPDPEPTGQYVGMAKLTVAQNTNGFAFVFLHGMLS